MTNFFKLEQPIYMVLVGDVIDRKTIFTVCIKSWQTILL